MRRIAAALLLAIFGIPTLLPAFFADSESSLPACCRRLGKHHCAAPQQTATGTGFTAAPAKCPSFPDSFLVVRANERVALLSRTEFGVDLDATSSAAPVRTASFYTCFFRHSDRERGPPALLS